MSRQMARRGLYLGSQVVNRLTSALLGIYAARVLGPEQLGVWAIFQVLYLYTAQAHLGTVNAMLREAPVARAQGDHNRVREIVEATWGFVWVASTLAALGTGAAVYGVYGRMQPHAVLLVASCVVLVFVQLHSVFFNFYCFAFGELSKLAVATLLQQGLTAGFCVLLLSRFGVAGYMAALAIGFIVMFLAARFGALPKLRPRMGWKKWRALIAIGLPMLPSALMLYFNISLDRLMVGSRLGVRAVGLFTVGAFLFQFGAALWDAGIYSIYSRMVALHTSATEGTSTLGRWVDANLPGLIGISSAVQGVMFLAAPLLIRTLLPAYEESISTAQVLVLGVNLFGMGQFLTSNLTVVGREKLSVLVRLVGLGFRAVALLVALALWPTFTGLACGVVAGHLLYAAASTIVWGARDGNGHRGSVGALALWAVITGSAVACWYMASAWALPQTWIAALLYSALLASFAWVAERNHGTITRFWSLARA